MPNVKLTYFNLRGRGEPCRILLAYGNDTLQVKCSIDLSPHSRSFYFVLQKIV